MERVDFTRDFAERLNALLQKEGHFSNRSKAGINISQLSKVAGVSYQMARKYALGMALPDYHILPKIAKWLNVSPGWLLFGEQEFTEPKLKSPTAIEIESELLKYILRKCAFLFLQTHETEKIINFIADVAYDASHIDADDATILKIINMMLSSAMQLCDINRKNECEHGKI